MGGIAEHEDWEANEPDVSLNDATMLERDSGVTNDQWNDEEKGDAMILSEKRAKKRQMDAVQLEKLVTDPLALAEEDDS